MTHHEIINNRVRRNKKYVHKGEKINSKTFEV